MIDTHCHLTDPRLLSQLDDVLKRAADAGVKRMVTIGTDLDDDRSAIAVCSGRANLNCVIGVHPNYCHEVPFGDLPLLRELQFDPSVVALGEMGLDYHHKFADVATQRKFFEWQLQLAAEFDRPVVIHCREAVDDTLAIMKNFPTVGAVFHCFTGTADEARRIIEQGYLLGFTGVVTFKKSDAVRDAVKLTPQDKLLVETDAPYLSPEPVRKEKVNEPAFVMHTARFIAAILEMELEELDRLTTENAKRFYRLSE